MFPQELLGKRDCCAIRSTNSEICFYSMVIQKASILTLGEGGGVFKKFQVIRIFYFRKVKQYTRMLNNTLTRQNISYK